MLKRKQPLALPKSSHSNSYYFTMNDRAAGAVQTFFIRGTHRHSGENDGTAQFRRRAGSSPAPSGYVAPDSA